MTTLEKKRYLGAYIELLEDLNRLTEELGFWDERRFCISTQKYTITRGNGSGVTPNQRYLEMLDECQDRYVRALKKKHSIEDAINCLEDPVCRRLLKLKYLENKTYPDIASEMGYTTEYIYTLMRKALEMFDPVKTS